ncbi:MAG: fatty acid desaturase [Balneolaceae bacterium]|nr:fatty acid desaturase [Balneolaceae bacterium]
MERIQDKIYHCDTPGDILLLDRKDISHQKREKIRELQELNYWYNLKIVFFMGLWIAAGYLLLYTNFLFLDLALYFLIACAMVGMPIIMHESNHNLLFKNRFLNRWVGFFCGLPGLVSVTAYRTVHLAHHANTGTEDDPDNMDNSVPKSVSMVLFFYLFLVLGAYLYIFHVGVEGYKIGNSNKRKKIVVEYLLILGIYGLVFWFIPFYYILHLWLIPLIIGVQLTNVRGLAEHGLITKNNVFTETRCVESNAFVSFMMCNLNYHLDHHLFPGVPWYNLPKLHKLLEDEYIAAGFSVYSSYTQFLVDFFKTTWSGYIPDFRMIPEHMKDHACG